MRGDAGNSDDFLDEDDSSSTSSEDGAVETSRNSDEQDSSFDVISLPSGEDELVPEDPCTSVLITEEKLEDAPAVPLPSALIMDGQSIDSDISEKKEGDERSGDFAERKDQRFIGPERNYFSLGHCRPRNQHVRHFFSRQFVNRSRPQYQLPPDTAQGREYQSCEHQAFERRREEQRNRDWSFATMQNHLDELVPEDPCTSVLITEEKLEDAPAVPLPSALIMDEQSIDSGISEKKEGNERSGDFAERKDQRFIGPERNYFSLGHCRPRNQHVRHFFSRQFVNRSRPQYQLPPDTAQGREYQSCEHQAFERRREEQRNRDWSFATMQNHLDDLFWVFLEPV
ncbi:unnamed protein product [Gongylonema pulchrum]|uniref:Uncharacterized protein n=1 Tax=Gongylonema pulchrum TaxID=637853 RepID=A0A3P7LWB0_9BILA|nr:unnamed protein product [Gongylonema pulchrum]